MHGFSNFPNEMQLRYLDALKRRVDQDPAGKITLPVGVVDAGDVDQVLRALKKTAPAEKPRGAPAPAAAPTYSPDHSNALAASAVKPTAIKLSEIKAENSVKSGSRSALPLNLVGGGSFRFDGVATTRDRQQITAAIDSELGVGPSVPVISSDGVRCYVVPPRRQR